MNGPVEQLSDTLDAPDAPALLCLLRQLEGQAEEVRTRQAVARARGAVTHRGRDIELRYIRLGEPDYSRRETLILNCLLDGEAYDDERVYHAD